MVFPKTTAEGYYNKKEADPYNEVDYYLSDSTGLFANNGSILWRRKSDGSKRRVAGSINNVIFYEDVSEAATHNYVEITVISSNGSASGAATTSLTERVVYVRNH